MWYVFYMTKLDLFPSEQDLPGVTPVSVYDKTNPFSAYNLVSDAMRRRIDRARELSPELFDLDEAALLKVLTKKKAKPTPTDNRLRMNFWNRYEWAFHHKYSNIQVTWITAGVCANEYFLQNYLARAEKVAWLLTPPASYTIRIQEGLSYALDKMRAILDIDPFDQNGKPNPKVMSLQIKIYDLLEKRALGAIPQKIEQTNKNLTVTSHISNETLVNKEIATQTMLELDKKIKELEKRDRTRPQIDVKAEVEEKPDVIQQLEINGTQAEANPGAQREDEPAQN